MNTLPASTPRHRSVAPIGAVGGAVFALVAALAGIAAHGLADPAMSGHIPSFDALFLLTSGVAALGALAGYGAQAFAEWAQRRGGGLGAVARRLGDSAPAGVLLPVTVGQWFSHAMLVADHKLALTIGALGPSALGSSAAPADGLGHVHGTAVALSPQQLSALPTVSADHGVHWLPMVAAHALGVLVCLALFELLARALRVVAKRVLLDAPRPALPARAHYGRRPVVACHSTSWRSAAVPRGPPLLLAS